MILVPRLGSNA